MAIKAQGSVKDILRSNIFGGVDQTKKSKKIQKGQRSGPKNLILEAKESLQAVSPNTKYNEQYPLSVGDQYLSMLSPITPIDETVDFDITTNDELILESPHQSPSISHSLSVHEHNSSISSIESLNSSQAQTPDPSLSCKKRKSIELDERPKASKSKTKSKAKTKAKSKKKNKNKNKSKNKDKNKDKNKNKNKNKNVNKQQKKKKKKKIKQKASSSVPEPSKPPAYDYNALFGDNMIIGAIKSPAKTKKDNNVSLMHIGKITSKPIITTQYNDLDALGGIGKITSTTYTAKAVVNVKHNNPKPQNLKTQNQTLQRSFTTTAINDMDKLFDLSDLGIDNLEMDNATLNEYDINHISDEDEWRSGGDDGYHSGSYSDSYTHSSRSYSSYSGSESEYAEDRYHNQPKQAQNKVAPQIQTQPQQQAIAMIAVDDEIESESMTWSESDLEMPMPKPSQLEIEIQESKSRQASRVSTPVIAMADVLKTHEIFNIDDKIEQQDEIQDMINMDKVTAEEEKEFQDNRQKQFMDDLDAFFDDDEDEEEVEIVTENQNIQENAEPEPIMDTPANMAMDNNTEIQEPVKQQKAERKGIKLGLVMKKFEINDKKNLKKYYISLGIKYGQDFVDHEPTKITKPSSDDRKLKKELGTQTRMRISKMAKWIICKCDKGKWDGKYKQEWLNMEDNTITYTFGQTSLLPRRISLNSREDLTRLDLGNNGCYKGNQRIIINDKIMVKQNKNILIKIEQMADIADGNRIRIGVIFYDENGFEVDMLWINDIMQIHTNDGSKGYLCLSNNQKQMDTDSEIKLNIDNNTSTPSVTFSHGRNYRVYKHHKKEYFMDNIMNQSSSTFAKVFIEQMKGEGIYQAFEQESKSTKKSKVPRKSNKDRLKAKALMKKRRSRNKLNQNKNANNVNNVNNKRSSKTVDGKPKRRVSI